MHRIVAPNSQIRRPTTCRASKGSKDSVTIRFAIPYSCRFGQHLRVVGSCDLLGNWDLESSLPMTWNEGDLWSAEMKFPANQEMNVEYKYVVCESSGAAVNGANWKPGNNFILTLPGRNGSVKVRDAWDEGSREVQIETIQAARGRKAGGNGGDGGSGTEDDDGVGGTSAVAAISLAASSALEQLDSAVRMSLELLEANEDVASTEMLAADRMVAAAVQRATTMTKALDVASSPSSDLNRN